jgi:mono/diheme cytochrome c family protein
MKMRKAARMGSVIMLAAIAAMCFVVVAKAGSQQAGDQGFAWKDGAEVYTKICALCHETRTGPAIRGRGHDPLYIQLIVRNGSRAMPAFRASEIDDQTLEKLAEYVSKSEAP